MSLPEGGTSLAEVVTLIAAVVLKAQLVSKAGTLVPVDGDLISETPQSLRPGL